MASSPPTGDDRALELEGATAARLIELVRLLASEAGKQAASIVGVAGYAAKAEFALVIFLGKRAPSVKARWIELVAGATPPPGSSTASESRWTAARAWCGWPAGGERAGPPSSTPPRSPSSRAMEASSTVDTAQVAQWPSAELDRPDSDCQSKGATAWLPLLFLDALAGRRVRLGALR